MKKTSLMLAISALLYGTSSYVLAEDEGVLHANMTPEEVADFLATLPNDTLSDVSEEDGWTEAGPLPNDVAVPEGLEPFVKLPANVYVDNGKSTIHTRVCTHEMNGATMAQFPVEVTVVRDGSEITTNDVWRDLGGATGGAQGFVSGAGWIIVQQGDTWYLDNPWRIYTVGDVAIKKVVLKPIVDVDKDGRKAAFDIGGLIRPATIDPNPLVPDDEHTNASARGRPMAKVPAGVSFTATYSDAVYVAEGNDLHGNGLGGTPAYLVDKDSTSVGPGEYPTHDLYGKLTIEFSPAVQSATLDPLSLAFSFVADTDCILPVIGGDVDSDSMTLTLFGEGLAYALDDNDRVIREFEVDKGGVGIFDINDLVLEGGHCYRLVNEDLNIISLEVNGEDMPDDQVCL